MKLTKIGVQLYTIRDYMNTEEQIRDSFHKLKALGYDEIQTAGCAIPYATFGALAREAGLTIVGTHDDFDRMCTDPSGAMDDHDLLGTKLMGTGGFFSVKTADYDEFITKANHLAEKIRDRGFTFTYHNHSHEFIKAEDGRLLMERLVDGLDPSTTGFVLDTFWVQHGGGDVRYWIEKLAGRVDILHLKDMGRSPNGAETPQFITEIGNGNLYWRGILETAHDAGVKHYVVEQDICPGDPFESLRISSEYLHRNFF